MRSLDAICADWAYWNDTYEFVEDLNEEYVADNINPFALQNLDVDLMVFLNENQQVAKYFAIDPESHEPTGCPEDFQRWLESPNPLTVHTTLESAASGYLWFDDSLVVVVSRPILTSEGDGPIHGALILGKVFDPEAVDDLKELSKTDFSFQITGTAAEGLPDTSSEITVEAVSEQKLRASTALRDPTGKQVGNLVLWIDRDLYQHGHRESSTLLTVTVGIGCLIMLVTLLALRVMVLTRLEDLTSQLDRIVQSKDRSTRVVCDGGDELGRLGRHLNRLLDDIESSEKELKEMNVELQKAAQAKSDFLSTITHELRTPLNAIIGTSSVIQSSPVHQDFSEYAQIIGRSSETLMGLINNVLDYTKLEAGKLELERLPFNLLDNIEGVVEIVSAQKKNRELEVFCDISPEVPRMMKGDALRLNQILLNLLGNAIKFTKAGYVCVKVRVGDDRQTIVFSIIDTGIGIAADKLPLLFRSFTQVDASTTRNYGGTGLGLSISLKLAEAMGGTIVASSEEGKGSIFEVKLPLVPDEDQRSIADFFASKIGAGFRVAIHDVEEPRLSILQSMFRSWNMEIVETIAGAPEVDCQVLGFLATDVTAIREKLYQMQFPETVPTIYLSNQTLWPIIREFTQQPILTFPLSHDDFCSNLEAVLGIGKEISAEGELIDSALISRLRELNLKVLLVEDNRMNQKVFVLMAQKLGLEVDIAADGVVALEKVYQSSYDLIFMDYHMPNLNGLEATYKIRQMEGIVSQPWVIGFSANVESQTLRDMMNAGMNDTLPKPMKLSNLRHAISNYLKISGRMNLVG